MNISEKRSYEIHKIAKNFDIEVKRLKAQVDLFWDKEIKIYKNFGLNDGMSIVEFGCGPGYVTEKLLSIFPNITITSVEIDPDLVEEAKRTLSEKNFVNYEVINGSIMGCSLSNDKYDFAITRLVLEHLPDPVGAVKEVCRVLKPNGIAVFVDNDFGMHIKTFPDIPELGELYDAYCRCRCDEGGRPQIGRELPGVLKQGGLKNIDFEIMNAHSNIIGDELFSQSEGVGIPLKLINDGYLTSKVLGQISVKWRNMLRNENHSIVRQLYIAIGEKG